MDDKTTIYEQQAISTMKKTVCKQTNRQINEKNKQDSEHIKQLNERVKDRFYSLKISNSNTSWR